MINPRITFNPNQMGGQACIRGMRIPVATIVRCVANGMSGKEIIENYPKLEPEDVTASLEYAAVLTADRLIPLTSI
jgi:uncharacterized protein (DUF433 family)